VRESTDPHLFEWWLRNVGIVNVSSHSLLPCDATCKRGLCRHAVSVCLSVRLCVTFVDSVKPNKRIFNFFSPSGSHTILVFPYQMLWRHSDGDPDPLRRGASNTGEVGKNHDSRRIAGYRSMTYCCSANNNCDVERCSLPHSLRIGDPVCDNQHGRPRRRKEKRT